MLILYNLSLFLYQWVIRILANFHPKAQLWWEGRQGVFAKIKSKRIADRPVLWMHCASLGEFEQGRPVLEQLRSSFPHYQIVLSFFSPSAYEIRKDYPIADIITYLPLDSKKNAQEWMKVVQPDIVIFVKYEFWHHYLQAIKKSTARSFLISASFRPQQIFFKAYGPFFQKMLHCFDHLFVQEEKDQMLLQKIGLQQVSIAGDTRVDRVLQIAKAANSFPLIEQFSAEAPVLIFGSSWPAEEEILAQHLQKNPDTDWKFIIAPHEIGSAHLLAIEKKISWPILRYSQANAQSINEARILLIDNIGMLSALYKYGKIAFIGGGFGTGIHNTLEPIAFGLPVIFGPRYQKFMEAKNLVKMEAAFSIQNHAEFETIFTQLKSASAYQKAVQNTAVFLTKNKGASERILAKLEQVINSH